MGLGVERVCKGAHDRPASQKRLKEGPHVSKVGYDHARCPLQHILPVTRLRSVDALGMRFEPPMALFRVAWLPHSGVASLPHQILQAYNAAALVC